jgi:hypothetical protein
MNHKLELTTDEMDAETAAALPDREAMSVPLLNIVADLDLALDIAAPVNAAAAINANVAAPIDAAVAANIGSVGSEATAVADQDSVIIQDLDGTAIANATQGATVQQ